MQWHLLQLLQSSLMPLVGVDESLGFEKCTGVAMVAGNSLAELFAPSRHGSAQL
jgi:hypothetical protein